MKKFLLIFTLLLIGIGWKISLGENQVILGPGVLAANPPKQNQITNPLGYSFKGYTITPLATFNAKAKVLSRKNYRLGRESDLSPVDLALGWGNMSDESVLEKIKITQSNRWYRWRVAEFPIPRREIETHSANMHLIPANDEIKSMISQARKGDIIELSGKLVRVDAKDGWHWISSLNRDDTGARACELILVEQFKVVSL